MRIFVSSAQKELQQERRAVKNFVEGDALLRRFFEVFLFEDLPASDRRADHVYFDAVDHAGVFVGIFGSEYGFENKDGLSPTELEFERATAAGKPRLIFIKDVDDKARHPKMLELIRRAGQQLIRRRFSGIPDLTAALYASLVEHLERTGALRTRPFDASACPDAALGDIDDERVMRFLNQARRERQYALAADTPAADVLAHLDLLDHGRPTHAAILLVGRKPQSFLPTSEVKCLHFHGTEVRKPIPSYQVYKGNLFDLVDQAVDFVMSKLVRTVGTRAQGPQAPVTYDLPKDAVSEAIVNAVAHRDYASNGSVQVMLFADRLEVWNPGELPSKLTLEMLRRPHTSIPRNPLIAEPLFLARYIERAGTGTVDMISLCREAGLPEPEYRQDGGQFVQTLWRDWLTTSVMGAIPLNDRQRRAIAQIKIEGRITNSGYQAVTSSSKKTAGRDLEDMVTKGLLRKIGKTGRGTFYVLAQREVAGRALDSKGAIKGTMGTRPRSRAKRDIKGTKGTAKVRRKPARRM